MEIWRFLPTSVWRYGVRDTCLTSNNAQPGQILGLSFRSLSITYDNIPDRVLIREQVPFTCINCQPTLATILPDPSICSPIILIMEAHDRVLARE